MNQLGGARRYSTLTLVVLLLFSGCAGEQSRPAPPTQASGTPSTAGPSTLGAPTRLASADSATSLAQSPDGTIYFTELGGRIRVLSGSGEPRTIAQFRVSAEGERGLLGFALHPRFPEIPHAYAFLSPRDDESVSRVVRFDIRDGSQAAERDAQVILTLPAGEGCCHKGGRITFGPDGKLYVTVGDNQVPRASQDKGDLRGKVLRYNDDGSIPSDGPFGKNPVWAMGLRNPFGMRFGADGSLWVTDNGPSGNDGPSCCDELNRVERGGNYGWPNVFGAKDDTSAWFSGEEPAVPTGLAIIAEGVAFCTYAWERMLIYSNGRITNGPEGCMLDVIQGRDGIYFSSSSAIFKA